MRIALVSQEYPPETAHGGIGSQTYLKAHGLAGLGHEVHVVSRSPDGGRRAYRDGDVHVTRVPGFPDPMPMYSELVDWITYSAQVAAAVWALHERAPLDLVDFPEWASEGYIHLLNQSPWNRIPTVIQLHGPLVMFAHTMGWPELDSELYRTGTSMEGTCLRLADAVYSSSDCSADWCTRHYGLTRERIPVIHTGVDTELFAPAGRKDDRPTIVFVGKLSRTKGTDLLVEAACRLADRHPGLRLQLIGRGEAALLADLRARVTAAGWPDLLDLPGFVDRRELPGYLARAHLFAAPSIYEGGPGFVYLEAMACGLPVVGCAGSGASEAMRPEEHGLLIPPGDLDALVDALDRLLADPVRREGMGTRARRHVLATADSADCLARLEACYRAVVSGELCWSTSATA
jgi:glycosyltransferase involved in cell wall biosynthesis